LSPFSSASLLGNAFRQSLAHAVLLSWWYSSLRASIPDRIPQHGATTISAELTLQRNTYGSKET
jgi:hypothetical protein